MADVTGPISTLSGALIGNFFTLWFDFYFAWAIPSPALRPTAIIIPFPVKGARR